MSSEIKQKKEPTSPKRYPALVGKGTWKRATDGSQYLDISLWYYEPRKESEA